VGAATGSGGGVYNAGTANVTEARLSTGTADHGGGILNQPSATLNLLRSTISANTALVQGGGVSHNGTNLTVDDSTVSGNTAPIAGGILNFTAMTITDSTVTLNSATSGLGWGGGVFNNGGAAATIGNSIISANVSNDDCGGGGTYTTGGYNYRGASCALAGTGDVAGSAPNLNALGSNGGFTLTHLPIAGSPVIGTGNPACAGTDQRGLARPQGGTCDKGAVDRA
jgi:hypothetical protein